MDIIKTLDQGVLSSNPSDCFFFIVGIDNLSLSLSLSFSYSLSLSCNSCNNKCLQEVTVSENNNNGN